MSKTKQKKNSNTVVEVEVGNGESTNREINTIAFTLNRFQQNKK